MQQNSDYNNCQKEEKYLFSCYVLTLVASITHSGPTHIMLNLQCSKNRMNLILSILYYISIGWFFDFRAWCKVFFVLLYRRHHFFFSQYNFAHWSVCDFFHVLIKNIIFVLYIMRFLHISLLTNIVILYCPLYSVLFK